MTRTGRIRPGHEVPRDATDQNPPEMRILEGELTREAILEIAQEALRDDRVDLVLQPIVSLPQRKRRHYECFSRLRTRNGLTVLPEHYISIAEEAGFIDAIDNMLLFRCVQLLRKVERSGEMVDFFCNLSGRTLTNGSFFGDFLDFLESEKTLAPRMVFEFCQPLVAVAVAFGRGRLGFGLSIGGIAPVPARCLGARIAAPLGAACSFGAGIPLAGGGPVVALLPVEPRFVVPMLVIGVAGRRVVRTAVGVAAAVVGGVTASAVGIAAREQRGQGGHQGEARNGHS